MIGLNNKEKIQVHELLESWLHSNRFQSIRNQTDQVKKSIIQPIIDIFEVASEIDKDKKGFFIQERLKELSTSKVILLNQNGRKELINFSNRILADQQFRRLTYEQQLYFLLWLRRFL